MNDVNYEYNFILFIMVFWFLLVKDWFILVFLFIKIELNVIIVLVELRIEWEVNCGSIEWVEFIFLWNVERFLLLLIGVDWIFVLLVRGWEIVVVERDVINDNFLLDIVGYCWNKGVVDVCIVCVVLNEVVIWLIGVFVWLIFGGDVYEGDFYDREKLLVCDGLYEVVDKV